MKWERHHNIWLCYNIYNMAVMNWKDMIILFARFNLQYKRIDSDTPAHA
jgi:hypothetical protein